MSKPLLPIDEALATVLRHVQVLPTERVPLAEAHGRVLATSAHADQDMPGFDRAAMDGIAVRAVDAVQGACLRAVGEAAAGRPFEGTLGEGQCVRIMTGAVLPAGADPLLQADSTSVLYWVHDAPLLSYLGVSPSQPRFAATHYGGDWLRQELQALASDPGSARSNRLSLLLANRDLPSTRTVTHVLWAMFGLVPPGATQAPHRHQSVALDLIVDCQPGVYTLVGTELNADGSIRNPRRIDWQAGGAFITPPGHWHAHINESGSTAWLLPIQDAGLQTYLRSLDIRFS